MSVVDPDMAALPRENPWVVMNRLSIASWLRAHGKFVRPELTKKQRLELKECFELIDADGSGAIDASEMLTAFHVLGLRTKRAEIEEMLASVDADGSGEVLSLPASMKVEYAEFVQIMTTKMDAQSQEQEPRNQPGKSQPLPFQLLAQAYRRKKLMEAVMGGDKSTQERLQARAEEMEAERLAAIAEAEAQKRQIKKRPKLLSEITKERIRWKARLQKQEQDMPLEGYVLERIDQDIRDVLFDVHERAHIRRATMSMDEKIALEEKFTEEKKIREKERRVSATKSSGTPLSSRAGTQQSFKRSMISYQKDNETLERGESAATSISPMLFSASDARSNTPELDTKAKTNVQKSIKTPQSQDSASESGFISEPPEDTPDQQRAFSISKLEGGQIASLDSQLQSYYKEDLKNICSVRSKLRDKPTLEQQKIRLQALHSMNQYYQQEKDWENREETMEKMNTWDSIHTPWRLPSYPIAPRKSRNVSHARIQYKAPVKLRTTRLTKKRPEWVNNIHLRRP